MSTGSSTPQANNRVRLTGAQFQPMLKRLTERLYDTVNRGPVLRSFATKSSRSRLDVVRLNGVVRDADDISQDFASYLVQRLVRNDGAKVSFELDIAARDVERRQRSLALYYALTQGIIRGADAIFRESGLRSLWLAYPFLLARDITDPENRRSILAPIYYWPIQIQASLEKQGELIIRRDPQAGGAVFNRVLARWTRMNLAVDLPAVELDMNEDGQIEMEEIEAAVRSTVKGLADVEIPNMSDSISPVPARAEVDALHQPSVLNCGILGLFVSENQALIENLERMQRLQEIHDPLESILANRQADS